MKSTNTIIAVLITAVLSVVGGWLMVLFESGGRIWLKFALYTLCFVNIFAAAFLCRMRVTFPGFHSY